MQVENIEERSRKAMYSIEGYEGSKKWCFAIVLNRAQTNFEENPKLFELTLTQFEKTRKEDWFDEETRKLIYENEEENKIKQEIQKVAGEKLNNLRNYFSHYRHTPDCLIFTKNDPLRIIMEKAYERTLFEERKKQEEEDISIEFPKLFEDDRRGNIFCIILFGETYP